MAFDKVQPSGEFGLYFNGDLAGLKFLEKLNKGLSSTGSIKTDNFRRLKDEDKNEDFDLSDYLTFTIERGSEDSADYELLAFNVLSAGLENNFLKFKLLF